VTITTDYVQQGNERLGAGDHFAAVACFDMALRLDPRNAEAYFGRGMAAYQLGDYVTAVTALTTCLQLQPTAPGVAAAYALRCMARANIGDRIEAMADEQEVMARDPNLMRYFESQLCVGTAQVAVLAETAPAQLTMIVDLLTRA
jgi:Flp pilus assembly protein TadD